MKTLNLFIVLATLGMSLPSFAAIDCRPDMDCWPDPSKPTPPPPTRATVIGYSEIPSPECKEEDRLEAIENAVANSYQIAYSRFGKNIVLAKDFFFTQDCKQGIYSTSAKGNSWIVQAFGEFKRSK